MIRKYILLFGLFISVGFVNISYAAEGDIWVTPANQNVQTSEPFTFDVYFDSGSENLGAFNMYFDFDPAKIIIDTIVVSDGFEKGSSTNNYLMTANLDDLVNGHYRFAGINGGDANIANGDNIHLITIYARATSEFTEGTSDIEIRVNEVSNELGQNIEIGDVTNAIITFEAENVAPEIISNGGNSSASVNSQENQKSVATVVATDSNVEDTLTYSISGGADQTKFTINSLTGVLEFIASPNFEIPTDFNSDGDYEVQVKVSDGSLYDTQNITVTVTDVSENGYPVIYSDGGGDTAFVVIDENEVVVTTVLALDSDSDIDNVLKYSISGGSDKDLFIIDSLTGVLKFYTVPNFEELSDLDMDNMYEVEITVSNGKLTDVQSISVLVKDVTEIGVTIPMYRLFNTRTGAQLYTKGEKDRDKILVKWPEFEFTDNGPAFYATGPSDMNDLVPIYRLYNTRTGVHLYTRGVEDRDKILSKWSDFEFTDGVPAFYANVTS